jgi:hypothetical protein
MEARGPDSKLEVGSNVPISSGGTFEPSILVKLTGSLYGGVATVSDEAELSQESVCLLAG